MKRQSQWKQEDRQRLAERAAEWLDGLERADAAERAEFAEWLTASPRHAEETLFVTALAKELKKIDLRKMESVRRVMGTATENVAILGKSSYSSPAKDARSSYRWRRQGLAAIAAALVLSAIAGTGFLFTRPPAYTTAVGEQRSIRLDDGSTVELNTESRVQVRYSEAVREVRLLRGEALFAVQKDAARPFTVVTDDAVVRALGTQFNVYRHEAGTTVAVVDGKVLIVPGGDGNSAGKEISRGETARVAKDGAIERLTAAQTAKALAWREHQLVFLSDTLADIAAEFNRYNRTSQLIVVDARAGGRRYSGVFASSDPQSLIQFLREDPGLAFEPQDDGLVIREAAR